MSLPSAFDNARRVCALAAVLWMAALTNGGAAAEPGRRVVRPTDSASPSSFFYTTYQLFGSNINWVTCGYDPQSTGCFGSGSLGPFGRMCSAAGSSSHIIVADSNPTSGVTTLYFYKQEESSTPSSMLQRKLELPNIPASITARCQMSTLGNFLYFGTSESSIYYKVNMRTYSAIPATICGGVTSAITAGNELVVVSMSGCFAGYDKQGNPTVSGGEFTDEFVPGTNGFVPTP